MSSKVDLLRARFSSEKVLSVTNGTPIKAYLLPSTDAHQSEYLADHDFRVKFLTGFTGSNAYVAVTNDKAVLWTDGRYFLQATEQLIPPCSLLKQGLSDSISVEDFVSENLNDGDWIGIDPALHTYESGQKLIKTLECQGIKVAPIRGNLVDEFWDNRPPLQSKSPIVLTPEEHGRCVNDKLKDLQKRIGQRKCDSVVLSALDDIMSLLKLGIGNQVHIHWLYLLICFKLLLKYTCSWIKLMMWRDTSSVCGCVRFYDKMVFVPTTTNYLFGEIFASSAVVEGSPVQVMKGVKNPVELEGMRNSHIRDSAALISFLMWLEAELLEGRSYSEIDFSTISAAGDHAAKPHYHPDGEEGKRLATADQVYLLDSGAHYRDGTTDVTRTVWISSEAPVPEEFIRHNTLVLKGHINLANTVFPQAIPGIRLGHIVKACNVAASIGHRAAAYGCDSWIREGMVLTIEPGYYLEGKWGVRIENCYEIVKADVPSGADFLGFRALTLAPIQTSIIDKSMLTEVEVDWLNSYHDRVLSTVGEFLESSGKTAELQWLQKQCAHI
ncbi:peptidase, M24 family [Ostertagia ostertagi]